MLGVDLGSYALKYALSEHKKGAGFECRKAGFLAFSKDVFSGGDIKDTAFLASELRELWRRQHLPRETVLALYHPRMVIQRVSLPRMSGEELRNALYWEVRSLVPGEEDLQIGWHVLREEAEKMEVLYAALPSAVLEVYLEIFRKAGIRLEGVEPQILSLLRGFLGIYPDYLDKGSFVLLDVGFSKGMVIFFKAGFVFSRYIDWGLRRLWQYLRDKFNLLPVEALDLLRRPVEEASPEVYEAVESEVQEFLLELRRSLTFLQTEYGPDAFGEFFLCGGGSSIPLFRARIEAELNLNLRDVTLPEKEKPVPNLPLVLGAVGASLWS